MISFQRVEVGRTSIPNDRGDRENILEAAGFRSIRRHVLPYDPTNVWFVSQA